MFSIWLSLLIFLSVNIIVATNLRCNEDLNGSLQVIENCRACVIFIAPSTSLPTSTTTTKTSTPFFSRHRFSSNTEPSIEELFLFDEKKRRRRRQTNADTVIYQQCAREINGPLYGYDQTHCFCNSNQCNSNIQRCIYEVTSKRHFACYHGSNSSHYPLEIRHKCRSCRIQTEFNSIHRYECLTFGEREQNNRTHCTCQRPMCNQDVLTCQQLQQLPSQPRTNLAFDTLFNSTTIGTTREATTTTSTMKMTTTIITTTISFTTTTPESSSVTTTTTDTTTTITTTVPTTSTSTSTTTTVTSTTTTTTVTSTTTTTTVTKTTPLPATTTPIPTTLLVSAETEEQLSVDNSTEIDLVTVNETTTSFIELKHLKTAYIVVKNNANHFSAKLIFFFTSLQTIFFLLFIRCDY